MILKPIEGWLMMLEEGPPHRISIQTPEGTPVLYWPEVKLLAEAFQIMAVLTEPSEGQS